MNHLLRAVLPLFATAAAVAQTWTEVGDAPGSLAGAQVCAGNGALSSITGSLYHDCDVFLIQITDPNSFAATVSAPFDSQLFLFDAQGFGITADDDWQQSPAAHLSGQFVAAPGRYYLAITGYDLDPIAANGEIWNDSFLFEENMPNGPGAREAFVGFTGGSGYAGAYTIQLAGCCLVGKQLVLPDNHHLSENPVVLGSGGTTNYWQAGGGRFQILYEASHFASAGVNGPITIQNVLFRTEDGEPGRSACYWNGVQLRLGSTSLTSSTMSTNFATNLAAGTTTMGGTGGGYTVLQGAVGSTPNNWSLDIDLVASAATFVHDPTSVRPNLLIDVVMPNAAMVQNGYPFPPFQDTTGGPSVVRGRGVYAASPTATTGTDSAAPLVVGLGFAGAGGSVLPVPARNETYGTSCGGAARSFYQSFVNGQRFDLTGLTLTPDNNVWPNYYTVTNTAPGVDLSQTPGAPVSIDDDAVVTRPLGFTLNYPGGQVTSITASTNGFVWLMNPGASDAIPSVGRLLGTTGNGGARLAPCWYDFHCGRNTQQIGNAGLHVHTDTSGGAGHAVCYVTWKGVGVFNSVAAGNVSVSTFQCVMFEDTGVVQFRYADMPRYCANWSTAADSSAAIVGFSPGLVTNASVDPQSRDLSLEGSFATGLDTVARMRLSAFTSAADLGSNYGGRLCVGNQARWRVENVPPGTLIGVQLLDIAASRPGLQLPGITAPGCLLSVTPNALLWEVQVLPATTVTGSVPFTVPAGYDGTTLHAQYVVLGGLFGAPDLVTSASHGVKHVVGQR